MDGLYTIKLNNEIRGPFTESQLRRMWDSGAITADTYYTRQGEEEWHPLSELCESAPQAHSPADASAPTEETSKPAMISHSEKKTFPWSTILWIGATAAGVYLLYATDGCQHDPEFPYFSKGSRDAPVPLHSSEIPKITGGATSYQGFFTADLHNGTEWTIARVDVVITRNKQPTPESRRFRLLPPETDIDFDPTAMKIVQKKIDPVPIKPYSKGIVRTEIGDLLKDAKEGEWTWNIIEVFGFR